MIAFAASAAAQPDPERAEAAIREGVALRRNGDDAGALERFREAHALAPSGRTLAQIALAEQALGEWIAAERDLAEALASDHPWIAQHRATLEQELAAVREHVGRLELVGGPDGAEVRIDGARVGQLPLAQPLALVVGTATLEVSAAGMVPLRRSVAIRAGVLARETISLAPVEEEEHTAPERPLVPLQPPPRERIAPAPQVPPVHDETYAHAGWVLVASAGALGLASAISFGVREDLAAQWNDDARCLVPGAGTREAQCGSVRAGAQAAEELGALALALALASAVAASISFSLDLARVFDRRSTASLRCAPGALAIACRAEL